MKHGKPSKPPKAIADDGTGFLKSLPFSEAARSTVTRKQYVIRVLIEAVHDFFVVLTVVLILSAPISWAINAQHEAQASIAAAEEMAKWPRGQTVQKYHAAQAYNKKIAESGQYSLGEVADPYSPGGGSDAGSRKDAEYQSLLGNTDGVLGTIRVPKVSIRLPIYHGTSKDTLAVGAGHLYGTSLPVGGKSTNAVITGHRGLPNAMLFTRLDQLKVGDFFYIQTLGRTMGYKVKAIHVIDPADTHLYKVVPGKDLVTLMTCTPYGVNTQRLVITGERGKIPQQVPYMDNEKDAVLMGTLTMAVILVIGLIGVLSRNYRVLVPQPWHYDGTPVSPSRLFPRKTDKRGLPPIGLLPLNHKRPPTPPGHTGPKPRHQPRRY
ncbi:class C sortase [Bifidobacterium sp. ESL0790]|uniref:class C sortase n=1 Tax=Bifidobacterium sp. ESL0790 TaxID=2983233 RepID=UPI0023F891C6|nr:class C sortase [Bifidobacterium sp. ESL0790]WEV72413.1 class C sortase [Bifidobacterium sp. ESL0790]